MTGTAITTVIQLQRIMKFNIDINVIPALEGRKIARSNSHMRCHFADSSL